MKIVCADGLVYGVRGDAEIAKLMIKAYIHKCSAGLHGIVSTTTVLLLRNPDGGILSATNLDDPSNVITLKLTKTGNLTIKYAL